MNIWNTFEIYLNRNIIKHTPYIHFWMLKGHKGVKDVFVAIHFVYHFLIGNKMNCGLKPAYCVA